MHTSNLITKKLHCKLTLLKFLLYFFPVWCCWWLCTWRTSVMTPLGWRDQHGVRNRIFIALYKWKKFKKKKSLKVIMPLTYDITTSALYSRLNPAVSWKLPRTETNGFSRPVPMLGCLNSEKSFSLYPVRLWPPTPGISFITCIMESFHRKG